MPGVTILTGSKGPDEGLIALVFSFFCVPAGEGRWAIITVLKVDKKLTKLVNVITGQGASADVTRPDGLRFGT